MQTICHTKKYSVFWGAACFLWISAAVSFLNSSWFLDSQFPPIVEYMLNLSLLPAAVLLICCMILLFRSRPLLQADDKGLYLNLPPKNRGVVPWQHITRFELSPNGRCINLYIQRRWDLPDRCPERFDIQTDERGQLFIPLSLNWKVTSLEKTCIRLNQWRDAQGGAAACTAFPEGDEAAARRTAGIKGRGAYLLLAVLSILDARFWLLWLLLFLMTAGALQGGAELPALWALLIPAIPVLAGGWLLRRGLKKGIAALRRCYDAQYRRSVGL